MGCVPHVSNFLALGVLKSLLECDTWHPPDWATCPLPVFCHVAIDCAVQRLRTSEGKDVTGYIGSKNLEGQSTYQSLIPEDMGRRIIDFG
jgi:hypothetical protein